MEPAAKPQPTRLASLDGLRGLAALVVVIHHCLLTIPLLAEPYFVDAWTPGSHRLSNIAIVSPLHVAWDGPAAVYVFFVLSGLVLALPVINSSHFDWRSYYPRRLARIYLPAWAALVVAVVVLSVSRSHLAAMDSLWIRDQPRLIGASNLANDVFLLIKPGRIVTPLWSLQPELWFSILLPAFVYVAFRFRRLAPWLTMGALLVSAVGNAVHFVPAAAMPVFAIGTLLAVRLEDVEAFAARLAHRKLAWPAIGTGSLLMASAPWLALGAGAGPTVVAALRVGPVLAAIGLVVGALGWPAMRRVLTWRPVQYLGVVSFSLYLVHEPIILATIAWFGPKHLAVSIPIAFVLALIAAQLFYRFAEHPFHLLSRRIGRHFARRDESR